MVIGMKILGFILSLSLPQINTIGIAHTLEIMFCTCHRFCCSLNVRPNVPSHLLNVIYCTMLKLRDIERANKLISKALSFRQALMESLQSDHTLPNMLFFS